MATDGTARGTKVPTQQKRAGSEREREKKRVMEEGEEGEKSLQNYTQRARDVTNVQDGGNTGKT